MSVKLPDFTEFGGLNTQEPSGAIGRYEGAAEAPGMAMAQTGEAIQKGSDQIQGLLDRTNTMNAVNNFQQKAAEIGNDFYSKIGAARATAYPDYIQNLRNAADQISGTLVTNTARQAFQSETQSHIGNEMYRAGAAAGDGVKQYDEQVYNSHQQLNQTKFYQQVQSGDSTGAADTLTGAHMAMMLHLTKDLGIDVNTPDGQAVLQANINNIDGTFAKSAHDAMDSLPASDPRRVAFVASKVDGGAPALMNYVNGTSPTPTSNNNPGNLREVGATSGFRSFATPQEGIDALQADLTAKVNGSPAMKGNAPTLGNIIAAYAPPSENNTASYQQFVSQKSGIPLDQKLTPDDVPKILPAIVQYEGNSKSASAQAAAGEPNLTGAPTVKGMPNMSDLDRKSVRAFKQDSLTAYQLQKDQQQAADTQVMNQLEPKLADHSITYHDIESSNASGEMKNKLHELMDKPLKTDPAVFNDLVRRVNLPDGSADKLTDPKELTGYLNKGITIEDRNVLEKMMGDPDELKTFFKQGHDQLSKSTMMNIDGEGERRAYNWEMATRNQIKAGQEKGLSVHQMIDPTSKDYIGGNIGQFQETLEQQASNLAGQTRAAAAPAPLPTDKQRQPGESPDAYVKRQGL